MQLLSNKNTGDTLTAAEWNQPMKEIENVITRNGGVLSGADLTQLTTGIERFASKATLKDVTGTTNAIVLTTPPPFTAETSLYQGLRIRFRLAASVVAGPVTINLDSLGVITVEMDSTKAAPQVGIDLQINTVYEAYYNVSTARWYVEGTGGGSSSSFTGVLASDLIITVATATTIPEFSGFQLAANSAYSIEMMLASSITGASKFVDIDHQGPTGYFTAAQTATQAAGATPSIIRGGISPGTPVIFASEPSAAYLTTSLTGYIRTAGTTGALTTTFQLATLVGPDTATFRAGSWIKLKKVS